MGCCGGEAEVSPAETGEFVTPFEQRKCRDVFWLLCFIVFWGGMLFVGGYAIFNGNSAKLLYGIDSMGNICGTKNEFNGTQFDLTNAKKLYFLDPFEVVKLDFTEIHFAKSVCLPSCPSAENLCSWETHHNGSDVCDAPGQFRCPYYASQTERVLFLGHYDLFHELPRIPDNSTHPADVNAAYYGELVDTNATDCERDAFENGFGILDDRWRDIRGEDVSCGKVFQHTSKIPNRGPCFPVFSKTVDFMNRCIPDVGTLLDQFDGANEKVSGVSDAVSESTAVMQRYFNDLERGIGIVIICGLLLAMVVSILWLLVLRYFAGIMAWVAVIMANLIALVICFLCFQKAGLIGKAGAAGEFFTDAWESANMPDELNPVTKDKEVWQAIAWISLVFFLLLLIFTIVMIRRIKVAVACLKVAGQAIATMPMIMLFPILPFILLVILVAYWVVVAAMLYSVGDIVKVWRSDVDSFRFTSEFEQLNMDEPDNIEPPPDVSELSDFECYHSPHCGFQVEWNDTFWYMGLYHLFGLLWTAQFIVGFGYVTLAGAIGHYYWYRGDSNMMPRRPVVRAMYNAARYHLGSIALGSLILALIQFVRLILQYIDKRTRQLQDTSLLLKWCMCCVKCCMWCLEKVVKYINRNAYIMMAVKGTSYCTSAGRAVSLIISNALRLLAVSIVGDVLIFLGKLCVVGGCGVIAFLFADSDLYTNPNKHPDTFLSSPVAPIVLTVIVAYICASVFFQVYEMAVDTILLCFCEDCDVNGDEPKFAPPLLMKAIGQKPHESEAKMAGRKQQHPKENAALPLVA